MHLLQVNSNHIFGAQSFYAVVFDIFWPKGGRNKANIFINIIVIIVLCQRKCKKTPKKRANYSLLSTEHEPYRIFSIQQICLLRFGAITQPRPWKRSL